MTCKLRRNCVCPGKPIPILTWTSRLNFFHFDHCTHVDHYGVTHASVFLGIVPQFALLSFNMIEYSWCSNAYLVGERPPTLSSVPAMSRLRVVLWSSWLCIFVASWSDLDLFPQFHFISFQEKTQHTKSSTRETRTYQLTPIVDTYFGNEQQIE